MNFILKPSLQHISAVKIVSALRIHDDIKLIMGDMFYSLPKEPRYELEKKILDKVTKLQLPKFPEKQVSNIAKLMLDEILHWISRYIGPPLSEWKKDYLRWTFEGTVDYKKTAEMMVKDEELSISARYRVACSYCLESDIPMLWDKLPDAEKEYLLKQTTYCYEGMYVSSVHWAMIMDEMSEGNEIFPEMYSWQSAFKNAENEATTKYALEKLSPMERKQSLVEVTAKQAYTPWDKLSSKTLFFLLTQIRKEQQIALIEAYPYGILRSILHWPRQNLFLEAADKLCNLLTINQYLSLNLDIIIEAPKHDDYKDLIREFWNQSPVKHKKYIFTNYLRIIEYELSKNEDKNTNRGIRNDTTAKKKNEIDLEYVDKYVLNLIQNDEWDELKALFVG